MKFTPELEQLLARNLVKTQSVNVNNMLTYTESTHSIESVDVKIEREKDNVFCIQVGNCKLHNLPNKNMLMDITRFMRFLHVANYTNANNLIGDFWGVTED